VSTTDYLFKKDDPGYHNYHHTYQSDYRNGRPEEQDHGIKWFTGRLSTLLGNMGHQLVTAVGTNFIASMPIREKSMVRSKVFITNADLLRVTTEQKLRTFLGNDNAATITVVRHGDGVLTAIEAATPEQANGVATALVSSSLSTEDLAVVQGDSPQGQQLTQLYTELKQRELEINWTNRQWWAKKVVVFQWKGWHRTRYRSASIVPRYRSDENVRVQQPDTVVPS
jgi:hypothetical protein